MQQVEAPANIYNLPANLFVAGFIGSPAMNFMEAWVGEEEGRTVLYLGGTELGKKVYLKDRKAETVRQKEAGKKVILGIRPEDIWEYEDAVRGGFGENSVGIEVTVTAREMLGAEAILYFEMQNKTHAVRLKPENNTKSGESLFLYFDPDKIHVFDMETQENIFYREEACS